MRNIRKVAAVLVLLCVISFEGFAAPFVILDSVNLATVKQHIQNGTASARAQSAYQSLLKKADDLLNIDNPTVIDKTIAPPSNSQHDYLSISRYWWPHPVMIDNLPWVRKDGQTNPYTQTDAVDRKRLGTMTEGIQLLSLAYYFSENEQYAEKAASMITTWFLDEDTKMSPHLEFAQSVPGRFTKRPFGILDGRAIPRVIPDAMKLISTSQHWSTAQQLKMVDWFTKYLTWLTESELGKKGMDLNNNHGSWYKFQVAALAFYLNDSALLDKVVNLTKESLNNQFDAKGGQTHELKRSKSFFYSCFNLSALTHTAIIASKVDIDLWQFETKEGKSLPLAIQFLTPVIEGKDWPHPSMKGPNISALLPILTALDANNPSDEYAELISKTIILLVEKEKTAAEENRTLQKLSLRYPQYEF